MFRPAPRRSFEFDRLVFSAFVERRSPDLVRGLVLATAEAHRRAETEIEAAGVLEDVDQPLAVDLRPAAPEAVDQDVGGNEAFKRDVVRLLTGVIFS